MGESGRPGQLGCRFAPVCGGPKQQGTGTLTLAVHCIAPHSFGVTLKSRAICATAVPDVG